MLRKLTTLIFFIFSTQLAFGQLQQDDVLKGVNKVELQKIVSSEYAKYSLERILIDRAIENGEVIDRVPLGVNAESQLKSLSSGTPIYYLTDNANAAISIGANKLHSGGGLGYTLNGQGILVGEWDGGATLVGHQEFGSRATQGDNASSLSNHATHVAGTMIASGVQSSAKGMAHQASLLTHDWNNDNSEMASAASNGLVLSNHSYGIVSGWAYGPWATGSSSWHWFGDPLISSTEDYKFGYYSSSARTWDQIANNAPNYLIVKSAGNDRNDSHLGGHYVWQNGGWSYSTASRNPDGNSDGYDCISGEGVSKNVMTIGAVDDVLSYSGPASVSMSSFSGWGPTDDGRIKPDLVANGVMLYSSMASGSTAYGSMSGTSMSAPSATGGLALIQQHALGTNNSYLKSATLKALAIHTAKEAGSAQGPDYQFGWGLLDVEHAVEVLDDSLSIVNTQTLANNSTYTTNIALSSNPVRITIAWNDPAGTPVTSSLLNNTTAMLVNDLDLRLTAPSGQVYYPYVLNPNSPASAATTGDNSKDNVEMIDLPNGVAPGTYTLTVSHKGNLASTQEFSLIVTGINQNSTSPSCQGVFIQASSLVTCSPGDSVLLFDSNVSYTSINKSLLWSTGASIDSIWVTPTQTTTYWLQTSFGGVVCSDSIEVQVLPPSSASITSAITSNNNQTSISLTASPGVSYLWSDSSTTQVLSVYPDSTTTYSVKVYDINGCYSTASYIVSTIPITFMLDLSTQTVSANKGVHIAGNFQGWVANTSAMAFDSGLGAWVFTREFVIGDTIYYKFINGNDWLDPHDVLLNGCGTGPDGDRWMAVGGQADSVGIFHLSSCDDQAPIDPLMDSITVCANTPVQLNAPSTLTDILWSTGDTTQTIGISNPGVVWMSALYPNGVVINDTVQIVHFAAPSTAITASANTSLCPGEDVILATDTSLVSGVLWIPTQDTTSSILTFSPGSYFAQLTTTDGCIFYSDTIVVSSLSAPSSMLTLSDSSYFCLGDTLSIAADPGHSYIWNNGEQDSIIFVASSGDFWVEITSNTGCTTQSDTITAVMLPGVVLPVLFTSNAFAANGDTSNIKMIPYDQSMSYTWSVVGGNIIAGQGGENIDILWQGIPGDTAIVQLVVDNGLCLDSTTIKIYIITVGIGESHLGNFKLYPNPAVQVLNVEREVGEMRPISYVIYNALGENVQLGILTESISIESLPSGTYTLKISDGSYDAIYKFVKMQ